MPRRFKIVKGGTNESVTCGCMAVVERTKYYELTCECTEAQYFVGNVPEKWICPDCGRNRHVLHGQRQ
jgi:Zn finger protein HypA/HybF involved in hydrogenase expression